jgi:hypothetical protein
VGSLTLRVIPGGTGKIYIGTSAMNTSTLAGTIAILYPNAGAHSEEYTITDYSGDDGIDLCTIYVAGGVASEFVLAEYYSNHGGTTAPTYFLYPFFQATKTADWALTTSSNAVNFSDLRIQVIPGNTSKITLDYNLIDANNGNAFTSGNDIILYPNSGTLAQHNAWSEFWRISDNLTSNSYYFYKDTLTGHRTDFFITPGTAGENALVSAWRKQTSTGTVLGAGGTGLYQEYVYNATLDATPVVIGALNGWNWRMRVVPGESSKVYLGDSSETTTAHLHHVLYPNNTGSLGWSETFSPNGSCRTNFNFIYGRSDASNTADVSFDWYTPQTGTGGCKQDSTAAPTAGVLTATTTPVSLNRGNVAYLHVSVIPGQTGKIYVGSSTMNTTTFAGVYAILYPNSTGRWSETFDVLDPEGDGIPSSSFYFLPQVSGEGVIVSSNTTSKTPADGVFSVKASGAVGDASSTLAAAFVSSSTTFEQLRVQVIPGGTGKIRIGTSSMTATQPDATYANALKVLWPNTGSYNVGEGHSEKWELTCPLSTTSCYDLANYKLFPEVSGEKLLMFALGR